MQTLMIACMVFVYSNVFSQTFVQFFEKPDSVSAYEIRDIYYDEVQENYIALFIVKMELCQGFGLMKLDENGSILTEQIYCSQDSIDQVLGFLSDVSIQKIKTDVYYFRGNIIFSGFRTFDYWFDSELNSINYEISDTISSDSVQAHQVLRLATYSDKIIQTGQLQKLNFESDPYIRVIDDEGDEVWTKEYFVNDGFNNRISSLVVYDTILILGSTTTKINSSTSDKSQCHITFINQEGGAVLHEFDLKLPESSNLGPSEVIPFENNGNTYFTFSSRESTYNEDYFEFRNQIRYFITDWDGNIVDSIRLGTDSSISNGLFHNAKTDKGFISSGQLLVNDTYRSLAIGLFDETADTIWWSMYDFNNSEDYAEYYNITGQTVLPDGSIVICGNLAELELPFFQPVRERPFIIKLDPDGCLEPGCRENVNVNSIILEDSYDIFPNPSNGRFELKGQYKDLQLLDVYGNKINITSKSNGNATVVEVTSFSNGVFYLTVTSNGVGDTKKIILINK